MDSLTFTIESHAAEDLETDATFDIVGTSARIGRKASNDWMLPDATRHISGHHFDVMFEQGQYLLHDRSTNGTFLNGDKDRVVSPYRIAHGDRFKVGPYILHAQLRPVTHAPEQPPARIVPANIPPASTSAPGEKRKVQAPPSAALMGGAQVQAPGANSGKASQAQTPDFARFQSGGQNAARVSAPPVSLPGVRPQELIPEDDSLDDILNAANPAPEADSGQAPVEQDASPEPGPFSEPEPTPEPEAKAPDTADARPDADGPLMLIPDDDFDLGLPDDPVPGPEQKAAPEPKPVPKPAAEPFSGTDYPRIQTPMPDPNPPSSPLLAVADSLETQAPRGLGESFSDPTPLPTPVPNAEPAAAQPFGEAETEAPSAVEAAEEPAPTAAPRTHAESAFLEGFLEGARIENAEALEIPLRELGKMLGQCARLGTHEMMQMLQDRSAVKLFVAQEDRTMRIAAGNNPMKFMADPEQAFETLFVKPRDGYQTGPDGFENALSDIRKHQAAMMAAVQPAMADMLAGLSPSEIEAQGGGGGMLKGGNRKHWEEYNKRWNSRAAQGENGMVDAFIDAFARRYSEALDSL